MDLMMARIAHQLHTPVGGMVVAGAGAATATTALALAAQYGEGADFSEPAEPSTDAKALAAWVGGAGLLVGTGVAINGDPGMRRLGRNVAAIGAGVIGALLVGVPVARRVIADLG